MNGWESSNELVSIRPFKDAHVDAVYRAVQESSDELRPWMPWCRAGYCRDDTAGFIKTCGPLWAERREYNFAVFDKADDEFCGGVGLNMLDHAHRCAHLGYWIHTSHTGRGLAVAAAQLAADFGFAELKLERLEIIVAVGNARSRRVAEKTGAVLEGIARRRCRVGDEQHDAACYVLLREDVHQ